MFGSMGVRITDRLVRACHPGGTGFAARPSTTVKCCMPSETVIERTRTCSIENSGSRASTSRRSASAPGPSAAGCGAAPTKNRPIDAIHAALDHGINLIDTAPIYGFGRSEEIVGRAIRGRRDKVVLATKCGMVWDREEGEFFFHANEDGVTLRPSEKKIYKCLRPESIRDGIGAQPHAAGHRPRRSLSDALAGVDHARSPTRWPRS